MRCAPRMVGFGYVRSPPATRNAGAGLLLRRGGGAGICSMVNESWRRSQGDVYGPAFQFAQIEMRGLLVVVLLRILPLAVDHIGGRSAAAAVGRGFASSPLQRKGVIGIRAAVHHRHHELIRARDRSRRSRSGSPRRFQTSSHGRNAQHECEQCAMRQAACAERVYRTERMRIHTIPGRHWKFIDSSPNCVKPHPRTGRSLTVIFPTLLLKSISNAVLYATVPRRALTLGALHERDGGI